MCGVDSPHDKLAIGVKVGHNMATIEKQKQKIKNDKQKH